MRGSHRAGRSFSCGITRSVISSGACARLRRETVSAHFLVDVDGSIHQLVDTDDAAWTQGVLCANERDHLLNILGGVCKRLSSSRSANENLWAIGVEIVNSGSEPYPPSQIEACAFVSRTGAATGTRH